MSAGELLHGCWRADTPAGRARRQEFVEALLAALPIVPLTLPVMRVFAEIDAHLRAAGSRLPTSDLLIASTGPLSWGRDRYGQRPPLWADRRF